MYVNLLLNKMFSSLKCKSCMYRHFWHKSRDLTYFLIKKKDPTQLDSESSSEFFTWLFYLIRSEAEKTANTFLLMSNAFLSMSLKFFNHNCARNQKFFQIIMLSWVRRRSYWENLLLLAEMVQKFERHLWKCLGSFFLLMM